MISRVKQSSLSRSIGKIFLGTGIGQVVTFLASPIIARLYTPESFGLQSTLLAIVSPLVTLASMAFPIAIVVARSDEDALALARLALFGAAVASLLTTGVFLLGDGWLLIQLSMAEAQPYVLLIPLLVLALTMSMSASHQMTRAQAFGLLSQSSVVSASISSLAKIGLGFLAPGAMALILGNLAGYLVPPLMARRLGKGIATSPRPDLAHLKAVMREHRDFPLFRAPQNFIVALSQSLPAIFLTSGFGAASAGYYAVAMALAGAPVMLLGNAVQSVLYPQLTAAVQAGAEVSRLLLLSTAALFVAGLIVLLPIVWFGSPLFGLILGEPWRGAGQFAALLVPSLLFYLACRPAVAVIPALKMQRGLLVYEIIGTGVKVAALAVGQVYIGTATGALLMFSVAGGLAYLGLMVWVFIEERRRPLSATDVMSRGNHDDQ